MLVASQFMKSLIAEWKYYPEILRQFLGEERDRGFKTMTEQRKKLPISVEQARAQVMRLKEQSLSTEKKGQNSASKKDNLKKLR